MTKFEQVGVSLQNEATTKYDARKNFSYSCRCCCNRGMRIECDRCAIAATYRMTIAALDTVKQAPSVNVRRK